jgi:cytochrome bd-type quinol oxidase subunit 1
MLDFIAWSFIRWYRKRLQKRKHRMALTDPAVILSLIETEKQAISAAIGRAPTPIPPVDLQPIADGIQANIDTLNAAFPPPASETTPTA